LDRIITKEVSLRHHLAHKKRKKTQLYKLGFAAAPQHAQE
jgi:hypothetical protein